MANHIPGPWVAKCGRGSWGGPLPPQIQVGNTPIATVECREHIYGADDDLDQSAMAARDEANANLIAAAPELLGTCQDVLRYLDHCAFIVPPGLKTQLREAITKATGQPAPEPAS